MKRYRGRAAALACGLALLAGCAAGPADYETVTPEIGTVEYLVEDTGTVAYRDPYTILPTVSGRILTCTFEEGDAVTEGQVLYAIDATDLEDRITQARLSLKSAQEAAAQSAAACDDLTVRSSAAGSVTALYVHVGDFVGAGSPVADVVDGANLTLTVPFAPADAAAMGPGSPASVTFPAYSGQVAGRVERVYDAPTALEGGREGVFVEISLPNPGALTAGTAAIAEVGGASCMETGAVACATQQTVYAAQSGQVESLSVDVGSAVAVGQTVITIKNASLTNAAANAALALEQAAVSLAQLEAKRPDYTLLAPVDGVITARTARVGDFAAAATPMATLAETGSMCVHVDIDEIYIDKVWPGQEAAFTFTTDGGETRTYAASVRRVDDTGVTSGGVTDYTVELTPQVTDGLKAGMNVSVSITAERKTGCLRLPSAAVSGGVVRVLRDGKVEEVAVTTGLSGGGYTEITGGLTGVETIVLPS